MNLGPLVASEILLPLSYWSSGIGAEDTITVSIDIVPILRISLLVFIVSTEILYAITSELLIYNMVLYSVM